MELKLHEEDVYTPVLPEDAVTLMPGMVKLPEGFDGRVVIPEGVRRIEKECFKGKPITAVSLPKSLREIGEDAFAKCRLTELRVEGDGEKIGIDRFAFAGNPELTAITLGNCELGMWIFRGCPVGRVTLTGECVPPEKDFTLGFGGCRLYSDNLFGTVKDKYGGASGTYALKGKLAETNYKPDDDYKGCAECDDNRCYTLAGFEDDRRKKPIFEWEKVE